MMCFCSVQKGSNTYTLHPRYRNFGDLKFEPFFMSQFKVMYNLKSELNNLQEYAICFLVFQRERTKLHSDYKIYNLNEIWFYFILSICSFNAFISLTFFVCYQLAYSTISVSKQLNCK